MARGSPGPQNPSKYPKTGPNYKKWGELTQQGYTYNPETDTYVADPAGAKKQLQDEGLIEGPPKEQGLTDMLLPIGGTALAIKGGGAIGEALTSGETLSMLGDLFSGGGGESMMLDSITSAAPGAELGGTAAELGPSAFSQAAGAVGLPLAAYGAYQGIKKGDPLQAGLSGLGGVTALNALGYSLGPWGIAATIAAPAALSLLNGAFDHKSTKEYQNERWNKLAQSDDPALRDYAAGYLDVIDKGDGSGPTFQDLQKDGLRGDEVWGSAAFFEPLGGRWLSEFSEDQRRTIAQKAADEGLLYGSHGDILSKNPDRIKQIAEEVKSGKVTDPSNPDPNAGLLVPDINVANSGVKGPAIQDPTKQGLLV